MCGIIGFYTKNRPLPQTQQFVKWALFHDTVRGSCGTGISGLKNDGEQVHYKRALAGYDFIQLKRTEEIVNSVCDYRVVLGHNRAATRGGVKDVNCHPFTYFPEGGDDITLVHNGTVNNYGALTPAGFSHEVDSAHIAYSMAASGEKATLEKLDGWYVLVWYNNTKRTFNIARSDARDISFIWSKDGNTLYFASEYGMLDMILSKYNIPISGDQYHTPPEYHWLSWSLDAPDIKKFTKTKFTKYQAPKTIYTTPNDDWYGRVGHGGYGRNDQQMLTDLGLKENETIDVEITKFTKYNASADHGRIEFEWMMDNKTTIKGSIHSVSEAEWDNGIKFLSDWCQIEVTGAHKQWQGASNVVQLVGRLTSASIQAQLETMGLTEPKKKPESKVLQLPATIVVPGPDGVLVPYSQWRKLTEDGCAQCSGPIAANLYSDIVWTGQSGKQPLCHKCSKQFKEEEQVAKLGSCAINSYPEGDPKINVIN